MMTQWYGLMWYYLGLCGCMAIVSKLGQVYLQMPGLITIRWGFWQNFTAVPCDWCYYSSTIKHMFPKYLIISVTMNRNKTIRPRTSTQRSLATLCTQRNALSSVCGFVRFKGWTGWFLEFVTCGNLAAHALATLTAHRKLTWALPRAVIRTRLCTAERRCQKALRRSSHDTCVHTDNGSWVV